ncbi:MAG TPA: hypothetical protein VFH53_11055 [Phycisphaerae bacterium]|nr:hypothetical protein [Phycisphaerae bacterium]
MKGIVWCVAACLWLAWCGWAAGNEPPPRPIPPIPPIPAPASPVARIVSVTESLAKMDVAAGQAFAWELVQVLAKHEKVLAERKVEWPEALTDLKDGPRPEAGAPTDAERQRIYDQTEPLLRAANEMDPDGPPERTCPAKLGVALLVAVAEKCPSASACAAAASRLIERCLPDAEGRKAPLEELSPGVAARAYEVALGRALEMLAKGPSEDATNALIVAVIANPIARYFFVDAVASGAPDAEAIRKRAGEWLAQLQAVQRAEDPAEIRRAVEMAIKALEAVKAKAGEMAEIAVRTAAVEALAKKFLLAVNTENRAQALECLTAKSGEALAKAESLRAAFTGREDTKDVLYRGVGPAYGEYVTVWYRIVDTAGRGASAAKEMGLVKTETGWLLGEP